MRVELSAGCGAVDGFVASLVEDRVASRIFDRDAGLWGPEAEPEASIRLGWTDFADRAAATIEAAEALRAELLADGVDRIVLCGMGGSSLAPAVITRWSGVPDERFVMLDSTHPAAVRRVLDAGLLPRTAVVVSSKSGSTIETRSHLAAFEAAFRGAGIDPASRIVIVTDPGSPLDTDSRAAGRRVFNADPEVGGRFSALTAFGIVPSALAGADVQRLVADAESVRAELAGDHAGNAALRLAAAIAAGLPERYLLAVREADDARWGLGAWIEQLVAESTGKDGRGVLPIALPSDAPEFADTPANALPVLLSSNDDDAAADSGVAVAGSLGAQVLLWEVATAALGRLMGIDPFNQPDVESAKVAARAALAEAPERGPGFPAGARGAITVEAPPEGVSIETAGDLVAALRAVLPRNGYVAIQAYLDPAGARAGALRALRSRLARELGAPVALGFGPSYLHSVGQLHKGGPALGVFLQLSDDAVPDLEIPGSKSFGVLIGAQLRGDREVLVTRGRPVIALNIHDGSALDTLLAGRRD